MENITNKLYLVPSPLGDYEPERVIPSPVLELLGSVGIYVVEELRTVRRYLSKAGLRGKIDSLEFHELNEHTDAATVESYLELFLASGRSHIFIETPYRNDAMLSDICSVCEDRTLVCVAADITTSDEFIRTLRVGEWKRKVAGGFQIGKRPCVYIIGVAPGCGAAEKLVRHGR